MFYCPQDWTFAQEITLSTQTSFQNLNFNTMNKGLDPQEIAKLKANMKETGKSFAWNEEEEKDENFASFFFVGNHHGKEVIFDAFMYTLETEYASLTYDIAMDLVMKEYPQFANSDFDAEEGEHVDALEKALMEIEEEGTSKVSEFVTVDDEDTDYGVNMTVCLNIIEVDEAQIEKFVKSYNSGDLKLDKSLYSFEPEDEDFL